MTQLYLLLTFLCPVTNSQDFVSIPALSTSTIFNLPVIPIPDPNIIKRQTLAIKLLSIAKKHNNHPKLDDIIKIIEESETLEQDCIPKVFKKEDYISLAYIESAFDPYSVGNDKEMGTWQVLEWKSLMAKFGGTNPFEIEVNGKMMCEVLRWKYKEHPSYKETIARYNGYKMFHRYAYFDKVQKFKFEVWPELKPKPKKKVVISRKTKKVKVK